MKLHTTPPSNNRPRANSLRLLAVAMLLALTALPGAGVSKVDAAVLPIGSMPYGKSYGDWSVAYWQWAWTFPASQSPWASDDTGALAGLGQRGPVWFLGGSLGNSVERTFRMPAGKAIFMPVHQWIFGASVNDCEPSVPGVHCDVPTLQASAAAAVDAATVVEVTIDGQRVGNERDYRAASPGAFSLTMPADNLGGLPAGTYSPQVSDGYWLILSPMSTGEHRIQVHVESSLGFGYLLTYNITVAGRGIVAGANLSTGEPEVEPKGLQTARRMSWGRVKAFYH